MHSRTIEANGQNPDEAAGMKDTPATTRTRTRKTPSNRQHRLRRIYPRSPPVSPRCLRGGECFKPQGGIATSESGMHTRLIRRLYGRHSYPKLSQSRVRKQAYMNPSKAYCLPYACPFCVTPSPHHSAIHSIRVTPELPAPSLDDLVCP